MSRKLGSGGRIAAWKAVTVKPDQEAMTIWLARKADPPVSWREIAVATNRSRGVVRRIYAQTEAAMAKRPGVRPPDM